MANRKLKKASGRQSRAEKLSVLKRYECSNSTVEVMRISNIYELFAECKGLETNFLVRAVHASCTNRKGVKSFSRLSHMASQGHYMLQISLSQKHAARKAQILVKYYRVTPVPPIAKASQYEPITVYVVSAKEKKSNKVAEKDRVNWKLLTNLPAESFKQALAKIQCYQARWNIETYFNDLNRLKS